MNNKIEKYLYDTEDVFDNGYTTEDQLLKDELENFIGELPSLESNEWLEIFNLMNKNSTGGKVNVKEAYIVAASKIISGYANEQNFLFARKGKELYFYNAKLWLRISEELFIEFLKTVSNKLGIPEYIASSVTFVNKLKKQFVQDSYFQKAAGSENFYINLENGVLVINKHFIKLEAHHPKFFLTHLLDVEYDLSEVYNDLKSFDSIIPSKDIQKTLQHSIAQIFVKDFNNHKKICLFGMEEEQVSYLIANLKKLIPLNSADLDDMFIHSEKIKDDPTLLESLIVIPCSTDEELLRFDNNQTLFNWLMSGVKEIIKNKNLYISNECKEFKQRFNTVSLFVNETDLVKTKRNPKSIVTCYQDVLKQYELFCELNDEEPLGRGKFNKKLKALGFESTRRESGNVWFAKFA